MRATVNEKRRFEQSVRNKNGNMYGHDIWRFIDANQLPGEDEITSRWVGHAKPIVSIFLNTFNHADFIEDAIIGVLIQETDFSFEILIHDDASFDGTKEKIEKFTNLYPTLIKPIYQKENQYSRGLRPWIFQSPRALGDFVAICQGDDFWTDPKKLQKQVDILRQEDDIVITGHDAIILMEDGAVKSGTKLGGRGRNLSAKEVRLGNPILTLSACFRNIELPKVPERLRVLSGDTFLFSLLGNYGGYYHHKDIKHAVYRSHVGGVWSSLDERKKLEERKNTFFWMAAYYGRTNDSESFNHFKNQFLVTSWVLGEVGGRSGFVALRFQEFLSRIRAGLKKIKLSFSQGKN